MPTSKPWYVDRSRNVNKNELTNFIVQLNLLKDQLGNVPTEQLINVLPEYIRKAKNPNSYLTYFRDLGIMDENNTLGELPILYNQGKISFSEFILEIFLKRGYNKEGDFGVRPLIVVILSINMIYEVTKDFKDCYITWSECSKYLMNIKNYRSLTTNVIDDILTDRKKPVTNTRSSVLDICFNAWGQTPLFTNKNDNQKIEIMPEAITLINFISKEYKNLEKVISFKNGSKKNDVYKYLGQKNNGLFKLIPKIECKKIQNSFTSNEIEAIYNYLFGIKNDASFDYCKYFITPKYGIYKDFIVIPNIALRRILNEHDNLGVSLINYSMNNQYVNDLFQINHLNSSINALTALNQGVIDEDEIELYYNIISKFRNSTIQKKFKEELMKEFSNKCMICSNPITQLLVASHIKPFSKCDSVSEAEDGQNGLLLCSNHDSLFDRGLISFEKNGNVVFSKDIGKNIKETNIPLTFCIDSNNYSESRVKYMEYHRNNVFKK